MLELTALCTKTYRSFNDREYLFFDGEQEYKIIAKDYLATGSIYHLFCTQKGNSFVLDKFESLNSSDSKTAYEKICKKIAAKVSSASSLLLSNEDTLKFGEGLLIVAKKLFVAKKLNRPTLLRFHGDADGICSAIAMTSFLNCRTYQQNSAIYSVRDALFDIDQLGQDPNPLVVFVDFGSAKANFEGISILQSAGVEVLIVDHHPYEEKPPCTYFNSVDYCENGSKYPAGYLCSEIANILGSSKDFLLDLSKTACAADKSNVFEIDQKSVDKALVLDFLCAHASFGNKLEFYKSVLSKSDLFDSLLIRAKDEIIASSNKAKRTIKETIIQKTRFFVFSLEDSVTKGEWPPSSKVTTFIFEELVKEFPNDPIVCIGTNPKTIILRINDLAINEGFETNVIVEKLKSSMPDFIESGGGHPKAGAIRVKEGFVKDVLNQILRSFD